MKILYWNIRGIANTPSKLALRNIISSNNPDVILLAEPWMNFIAFPRWWLQRLGLKLFALNARDNLLSNIWCICRNNLDPNVVFVDNQCVAFIFSNIDKVFGVAAVYASNCHLSI
jgi:exonuclease III